MFDEYYKEYKEYFSDKNAEYRKIIIGETEYFVYFIDTNAKYKRKEPDLFWHISSIENGHLEENEFCEKYNDFSPCINTHFQSSCLNNCGNKNETFMKFDNRYPCEYRSSCIKYLKQLLIDVKRKDSSVRVWRYNKRIYIRKVYDLIDYVAIFDERITSKNNVLYLITAFPIQLNSMKKKFDNNYKKYGIK